MENLLFEIAGGSVAGRDHLLGDRNNHDAFAWSSTAGTIVAVVCDGCGSGRHSEVGAKLGARLVVEAVGRQVKGIDREDGDRPEGDPSSFSLAAFAVSLEKARQEMLCQLKGLATGMGGSFSLTVNDYFLFTIVGVAIRPDTTAVFSLGDGLFALNGEVVKLGTFPNNEPPYLAYGLVRSSLAESAPELLRFRVNRVFPTDELQNLLLGTDGVADLTGLAEHDLPGRHEKVGPFSQFWQEDRYFRNPDMVRRRLACLNRPVSQVDWENRRLNREGGLLPDDTTLIVIRRIRNDGT